MFRSGAAILALLARPSLLAAEDVCQGPDCSEEDAAALLQVVQEKRSTDPCGVSGTTNPKAGKSKPCTAAGFKFLGDVQGPSEDMAECCVPAAWTCNLGTQDDCKKGGGISEGAFLGSVPKWWFEELSELGQGNCCVAPIPSDAGEATWAMDVRVNPAEEGCKTTKVHGSKGSPGYTVHAFWTGARCMATAEVDGKYYMPKCGKCSKGFGGGGCEGAELGDDYYCAYSS